MTVQDERTADARGVIPDDKPRRGPIVWKSEDGGRSWRAVPLEEKAE